MVGYVEINQNSACMAFEWTKKKKNASISVYYVENDHHQEITREKL